MEKIQKGLHGINAKIPNVALKRDFLSFSLQISSLFVCVFSAMCWVIFGFDSTVDGVLRILSGEPAEMGNGTHISTILNFFLIVFLISNYLSKKDVKAFHNILISIFVPVAGMMAFEFPWVALTDFFHNSAVEGYWAITLYGAGKINFGMLALGAFLIPAAVFYMSTDALYNRAMLSPKAVINISISAAGAVAAFIVLNSLFYGTLTVLIRNTFALFFFAFAHATLKDATQNYGIKELLGKYGLKMRIKWPLILAAASIAVFAVWIWWPYFEVVKGNMWPQTVYAFYKDGLVDRIVYFENDAVRVLNVLSKALVTAAVSLAIIPRITIKKV